MYKRQATAWPLHGTRALAAQLLGLIPPTLSLGIPLVWALTNLDQLGDSLRDDLLPLSLRSLVLGISAAVLANPQVRKAAAMLENNLDEACQLTGLDAAAAAKLVNEEL